MEACLFISLSVLVTFSYAFGSNAILILSLLVGVTLAAACLIGIATAPKQQKARIIDPEELMHIRLYSQRY